MCTDHPTTYSIIVQLHTGSLVKKSKIRGVKIESLKLPSVVDFAVGEFIASVIIQCSNSTLFLLHLSLLPSPPLSSFLSLSLSIEPTRSHDWDSVVSCHAGHSSAQTWSLQKCVIGRHSLSSKHADSGARPVVSSTKYM